jgi:RimJ/RimL family protein N-acetyltransferase
MITTLEGKPIGALAYLDHDVDHKRAELRKLIGDPEFRGMGLAEEATQLWIAYGIHALHLEKIYVSTLQTHINNIKLNEKIGFQVEGLLRDEVLIDGTRHDVLRMGYCTK